MWNRRYHLLEVDCYFPWVVVIKHRILQKSSSILKKFCVKHPNTTNYVYERWGSYWLKFRIPRYIEISEKIVVFKVRDLLALHTKLKSSFWRVSCCLNNIIKNWRIFFPHLLQIHENINYQSQLLILKSDLFQHHNMKENHSMMHLYILNF